MRGVVEVNMTTERQFLHHPNIYQYGNLVRRQVEVLFTNASVLAVAFCSFPFKASQFGTSDNIQLKL